jgi:hypothetical protein
LWHRWKGLGGKGLPAALKEQMMGKTAELLKTLKGSIGALF